MYLVLHDHSYDPPVVLQVKCDQAWFEGSSVVAADKKVIAQFPVSYFQGVTNSRSCPHSPVIELCVLHHCISNCSVKIIGGNK